MPGSFDQPMHGDLLWVYEGLTQYLGHILTARSGLATPEQYRDALALAAAELDHRAGRLWRPLADTAVAAQLLYGAGDPWSSWRRSVDYYDEGDLIWLEADGIIRHETKGARSMDDFCRKFHGAPSGAPAVRTYTFDDVVATLNEVAPYDWKGFLTSRLDSKGLHAPMNGIEASGWRVVYDDAISERLKASEKLHKQVDLRYSIGLLLKDETGAILDALPGLPAYKTGIGPGMKVIAVNGRKFSKDVIREAIRDSKGSSLPIDLLVENSEYYRSYALDYHDGERYAHLERIPGADDLLTEIIRPHAKER
jgi:predicted metalloprotease with PDZ domain